MKRILCVLLLVALTLALMPTGGYAEDIEYSEEGYIVKLAPGAVVALSDEEVCHGFVLAEDEAELMSLISAGLCGGYEPNRPVKLLGYVNDEYYDRAQWNLWSINMEPVWAAGLDGGGVTVAVIDTGLFAEHEDLAGVSILAGYNVLNGGPDTTDNSGHGTMVSGIIAAESNNGLGIAGICDGVSLIPIKCFQSDAAATVMDICRGLYAAADNYDCDVICMSLGSDADSFMLRQAVNYAVADGAIIVAAAGNDGKSELYYPAAYDNVIGVGAYGSDGERCGFSQFNESVFVSAPGANIASTYIGSPDAYAQGDGTSFSAPHVAALAAIARSLRQDIGIEEFKKALIDTSTDAGEPGYDVYYGYGKVNAAALVDKLMNEISAPEPTPPVESPQPTEPVETDPAAQFKDVAGHWAEEYIDFCLEKGLFDGVTETEFMPDGHMTRAMLVTVLYRMSGEKWVSDGSESAFTDVESGAWYEEAVLWAAGGGIVDGYDSGEFKPEEDVTREQLAAILYRYSHSPAAPDSAVLLGFPDSADISDYALLPMAWCCGNGIVTGDENGLRPKDSATRGQVAAMLTRYLSIITTTPPSPGV